MRNVTSRNVNVKNIYNRKDNERTKESNSRFEMDKKEQAIGSIRSNAIRIIGRVCVIIMVNGTRQKSALYICIW